MSICNDKNIHKGLVIIAILFLINNCNADSIEEKLDNLLGNAIQTTSYSTAQQKLTASKTLLQNKAKSLDKAIAPFYETYLTLTLNQ